MDASGCGVYVYVYVYIHQPIPTHTHTHTKTEAEARFLRMERRLRGVLTQIVASDPAMEQFLAALETLLRAFLQVGFNGGGGRGGVRRARPLGVICFLKLIVISNPPLYPPPPKNMNKTKTRRATPSPFPPPRRRWTRRWPARSCTR